MLAPPAHRPVQSSPLATTSAGVGQTSGVSDGLSTEQELAGESPALAAVEGAPPAPAVLNSHKRPAADMAGDNEQQVSGGTSLTAAEVITGAMPPYPKPWRPTVLIPSLISVLIGSRNRRDGSCPAAQGREICARECGAAHCAAHGR